MTVLQPAGVLVSQQAPAQACTFDGDILLGKFYYSLLSNVTLLMLLAMSKVLDKKKTFIILNMQLK